MWNQQCKSPQHRPAGTLSVTPLVVEGVSMVMASISLVVTGERGVSFCRDSTVSRSAVGERECAASRCCHRLLGDAPTAAQSGASPRRPPTS